MQPPLYRLNRRLNLLIVLLCLALALPVAAQALTRKVAVVHYDPKHPTTGQRLSDYMGWADAQTRTNDFVSLISSTSGGYLNYQVVDFIVLDKFPTKRYTSQTYTWNSYQACRANTSNCIMPDDADYYTLMNVDTNLTSRIGSKQVDEVWVYGGGYFGFDEFAFKIPGDDPMYDPSPYNYWLYDGRKKDLPTSNRTYFVMGWILENGFDNQIHSYGHRIESALSLSPVGRGEWHRCSYNTPYTMFICTEIDGPNPACGDVHYPPNATSDYNYNNTRYVNSSCASYDNFPYGSGSQSINSSAWGGTQEGFMTWWLSHIPNNSGYNEWWGGDMMLHNWWHYIALYDDGLADLRPTSITYTKSGLQYHFNSGVENAGFTDTGSFNVKWYVNGKQVGHGGHGGVAGQTTVLNGNSALIWNFKTTGLHRVKFRVDTSGHVSEVDESNNTIERWINVTN